MMACGSPFGEPGPPGTDKPLPSWEEQSFSGSFGLFSALRRAGRLEGDGQPFGRGSPAGEAAMSGIDPWGFLRGNPIR